mgnify:CR=1 FL=1
MNKLIKYDFDYFCFILCNFKFTIYQLIPIRSKTTIPLSFSCFLFTTSHSLNLNIFTLLFCYC